VIKASWFERIFRCVVADQSRMRYALLWHFQLQLVLSWFKE